MIKLKVNGEIYTINKNLSVSKGKYQEIICDIIEIIRSKYNVSDGFFEPYLYIKLSNFKWIKLLSFEWNAPNNKNVNY